MRHLYVEQTTKLFAMTEPADPAEVESWRVGPGTSPLVNTSNGQTARRALHTLQPPPLRSFWEP